jgi:hypothetical protein
MEISPSMFMMSYCTTSFHNFHIIFFQIRGVVVDVLCPILCNDGELI